MKKDLTGMRFGRLVVLREAGRQRRRVLWECLCDCGNYCNVISTNLTTGNTLSCGCIANKYSYTQSHKTRLYSIWRGIKQRCLNPNSPEYHRYGGRGITICKEWENDFGAFKRWASANGYQDNLTIDRINNNQGYTPDNCRWSTKLEQSNNMERNILWTYKGETKTITEWSKCVGIKRHTLYLRYRNGWTIEKMLTTPLQGEGVS